MNKIIKFWVGDKEQAIIDQVAAQFEDNVSLAIRYMIREHARLHMTVNQAAALVAEDEARDCAELVR